MDSKKKSLPLVIGLTGGIASGKTTVANYLEKQGAYLIDADIIARQVVEPSTPTNKAIYELLGKEYFLSNSELDRAKIKQLIFTDESIKNKYEEIINPAIRQAILDSLYSANKNCSYILLVVPLLFERGFDIYTDYNISVDISRELQLQRGIARKIADKDVIAKIISSQLPREERNTKANFIVDNKLSLEELYAQLDKLHSHLCTLTK